MKKIELKIPRLSDNAGKQDLIIHIKNLNQIITTAQTYIQALQIMLEETEEENQPTRK